MAFKLRVFLAICFLLEFTAGQGIEEYCETKDGGLPEELWSRETKDVAELPEDPNLTAHGVEVLTNEKLDIIPEALLKFCPNLNAIYIINSEENGFENLEQNLFETLFPKIIYLTIGDCKSARGSLKTVGPDALEMLPNLTEFEIILNSVGSISPTAFRTNKKLKKISITDNFLTSLDPAIFEGLTALRVMKMAANKIENLPESIFQGLENLLVANFQQNKLKSLPGKLFVGLQNLTIINFSRNRLEEFPGSLFLGLEKLQKVDFSYNALKVIPGDLFRSNNLMRDVNFSYSVIGNKICKNFNKFARKLNKNNLICVNIAQQYSMAATKWDTCPDAEDKNLFIKLSKRSAETTFGTFAQVPKICPDGKVLDYLDRCRFVAES